MQKNMRERRFMVRRKFFIWAKGVFLRFAENAKTVGLWTALVPAYCDHGSFLANFCMRERKPRHNSSETAFCLLVTPLAKAFTHKGLGDIWISPAGRWSFPTGHLGEIRGKITVKIISMREYARIRDVNLNAMKMAVNSGRIHKT